MKRVPISLESCCYMILVLRNIVRSRKIVKITSEGDGEADFSLASGISTELMRTFGGIRRASWARTAPAAIWLKYCFRIDFEHTLPIHNKQVTIETRRKYRKYDDRSGILWHVAWDIRVVKCVGVWSLLHSQEEVINYLLVISKTELRT